MAVNNEIPVNVHVLIIDNCSEAMDLLDKMQSVYKYQVTANREAMRALKWLREDRNMFDLVIIDIGGCSGQDIGFKFLEIVRLEMDDLPIVLMSFETVHSKSELEKLLITYGDCDYGKLKVVKNLWQHVIKRSGKFGKGKKLNMKPKDYHNDEEKKGCENEATLQTSFYYSRI